MDKSSNNAEASHLSGTCEKLPKPSNQDESSDFSDLQSCMIRIFMIQIFSHHKKNGLLSMGVLGNALMIF